MKQDNIATRRSDEVIETPTRGELVVLPQSGRRLTMLEQFDESWTPEPYSGCCAAWERHMGYETLRLQM